MVFVRGLQGLDSWSGYLEFGVKVTMPAWHPASIYA